MIPYHGTPCGATREDVARFLAGRHALIPWVRNEDVGTAAEVCQSFAFDNGAFSAWKSGKPIEDWRGYFAWVREWRHHPGFDWAIIPDVIDGTEEQNEALIRQFELQVNRPDWTVSRDTKEIGVPVWHLHESLQRLQRLADNWPRVALGSSGAWRTPGTRDWWERMTDAMIAVCDKTGRPRTKLHGLRMLDPAIFHRLPLASADSTNAVRNSSSITRFGMYPAPNASTRMAIIAERIEWHQSAAIWVQRERQGILTFDCEG